LVNDAGGPTLAREMVSMLAGQLGAPSSAREWPPSMPRGAIRALTDR
jgi:hypothetical protein